MKKIVIALVALSFATPAKALTWKEFWEPFVEYSNHHHHDRGYHYNEHYGQPTDGCDRVDYNYYYWVPGYYNGQRYVPRTQKRELRSKWVNCHQQYDHHTPHHHHH